MTYSEGNHGGKCSFRPLCQGLASVLTLCLQQQHGVFLPGRTAWLKALFPLDGAGLRGRVVCHAGQGTLEETLVHVAASGLCSCVKELPPPPHAPVGFDCFLPCLISLQCRCAASSACV